MILFEKGATNKLIACIDGEKSASESFAWNVIQQNYPAIAKWLEPFAEQGRARTDKGDYWWELRACDYYDVFAKPKIMYQKFQVKPCFVYDEQGLYCNDSMWIIPTEDKALLALLNSKMAWWLMKKKCTQIQNGVQLIWQYLSKIPVPATLPPDLATLADQIITAKKNGEDTAAFEAQVDAIVYGLYGVNAEDVGKIEG